VSVDPGSVMNLTAAVASGPHGDADVLAKARSNVSVDGSTFRFSAGDYADATSVRIRWETVPAPVKPPATKSTFAGAGELAAIAALEAGTGGGRAYSTWNATRSAALADLERDELPTASLALAMGRRPAAVSARAGSAHHAVFSDGGIGEHDRAEHLVSRREDPAGGAVHPGHRPGSHWADHDPRLIAGEDWVHGPESHSGTFMPALASTDVDIRLHYADNNSHMGFGGYTTNAESLMLFSSGSKIITW
jgi:hypothetical protein